MTEAVRNGVTFVPGAAMLPEASHLTHMRLSYGFLEPEQTVEGTKRLGRAIRSLVKRPRTAGRHCRLRRRCEPAASHESGCLV